MVGYFHHCRCHHCSPQSLIATNCHKWGECAVRKVAVAAEVGCHWLHCDTLRPTPKSFCIPPGSTSAQFGKCCPRKTPFAWHYANPLHNLISCLSFQSSDSWQFHSVLALLWQREVMGRFSLHGNIYVHSSLNPSLVVYLTSSDIRGLTWDTCLLWAVGNQAFCSCTQGHPRRSSSHLWQVFSKGPWTWRDNIYTTAGQIAHFPWTNPKIMW